jgi:hypothetical protein
LIESLKIFVFVAVAVIGYGIVHDQFTARICVEYFTVAHEPKIVDSQSPTIVGLAWGVYSTWRVGVVFGFASATLARLSHWPKISFGQLIKPVSYLVFAIAAASLLTGSVSYVMAEYDLISLGSPMASAIEETDHSRFLSNRWSHRAAHAVGLLGGSMLCAGIWIFRKRQSERLAAAIAV